jgi:hypothetical protein
VHDDLNPAKFKDHMRESRDSTEHPESKAVAILFDVTGSMAEVPEIFQKKLGKLMSFIIMKGGLEHPQIMVGGIGDATCDRVPLQMSQFESGNLVDEHLRKMVLEGGGGGQQTESYELALFAMARCTVMDCLEKRGEKGYLFLSGDEMPYDYIKRDEVKHVLGIGVQENLSMKAILEEVKEKFNVYFIFSAGTSNWGNHGIENTWKKYLGQNVLFLEDPEAICELIASTIALNEGTGELEDVLTDLKTIGADTKALKSVSKALANATTTTPVKGTAKATGRVPKSDKDDTLSRI